MTYWQFHLFFVIPALATVSSSYVITSRRRRPEGREVLFLLLMCLVAFVFTTPWDNYLVRNDIWYYGQDRVSHVIGYVPIEEYTFFVLQPLVTGLLLLTVRNVLPKPERGLRNRSTRITGFLFLVVATVAVLFIRVESFTYLRLIVGWSVPVVAFQWLLGGDYFIQRWSSWAPSIVVSTIFFSVIDNIAITNGIWSITESTSTGVAISGLPIEEAFFFLITNVLVVQGLMLFLPVPSDQFKIVT